MRYASESHGNREDRDSGEEPCREKQADCMRRLRVAILVVKCKHPGSEYDKRMNQHGMVVKT